MLARIKQGDDDIQLITSATTLSNSEVNYCFRKLEDQGLIAVEKQEGMVERVVDGTRQVFEAPKQASLTEKGERYLEDSNTAGGTDFSRLTRDELIEHVRELEQDLEELEQRFDLFSRQVKQRLFDEPEQH